MSQGHTDAHHHFELVDTNACGLRCRNQNGQLVLGDIITGIDGRPVKSQKDLFNILDDCKVMRPSMPNRFLSPPVHCVAWMPCKTASASRSMQAVCHHRAIVMLTAADRMAPCIARSDRRSRSKLTGKVARRKWT